MTRRRAMAYDTLTVLFSRFWFALVLTGTGRLDPMAPGTLGPKLNYRRVLPSTHVAHAQSRPALRTHRRLRWLGFS
jgi:hypothetical protein